MLAALEIAPLERGYEAFVAHLKDADIGPTALSPERFMEVFSLDTQTLADQAHVHRNSLTHAPSSENVQRFLREVLRVLKAAFDLSGDIRKVVLWYQNDPLPTFGCKTAERLISEGRTDDVLRYIASLWAGVTG